MVASLPPPSVGWRSEQEKQGEQGQEVKQERIMTGKRGDRMAQGMRKFHYGLVSVSDGKSR